MRVKVLTAVLLRVTSEGWSWQNWNTITASVLWQLCSYIQNYIKRPLEVKCTFISNRKKRNLYSFYVFILCLMEKIWRNIASMFIYLQCFCMGFKREATQKAVLLSAFWEWQDSSARIHLHLPGCSRWAAGLHTRRTWVWDWRDPVFSNRWHTHRDWTSRVQHGY